MKTAIVTGATGFIGKALCKSLLSDGYEVYGIGRTKEKFIELNVNPAFHEVILDFEQYEKISDCVKCNKVDTFFHTAYIGVNGPQKGDYLVQLQNLQVSCATVLQAYKMKTRRYVYVGSVDEYEATRNPDKCFVEPTHSRIYATIKYSSEVIGKVLAYENNMEYVSALLTLTYGEGNKTNVLPHMLIRNSINHKPINLISGDGYFDMIHIDEAIQGIRCVAESGKSYESYFIGHERLRTFKEIVETISNIIRNEESLNFGTYPDPSFAIDYEKIDRSKLKRDTGYSCEFDFEDSIKKTYKWIKDSEYEK